MMGTDNPEIESEPTAFYFQFTCEIWNEEMLKKYFWFWILSELS